MPTKNVKLANYRKTYLSLEEVLNTLSASSKYSNDKFFRLAFSFFFLLEDPYFDHRAHLPNSIQTFYANHYLRETLNLEKMEDHPKSTNIRFLKNLQTQYWKN